MQKRHKWKLFNVLLKNYFFFTSVWLLRSPEPSFRVTSGKKTKKTNKQTTDVLAKR